MSGLDGLFQRDAPPLQRWSAPAADLEALVARARALPDTRLLVLDGAALPDGPALFAALAGGLAFPPYFGANWNALDECLHDLEWLGQSAVLLVVRRAERLLEAEAEGLETLLDLLASAARELEEPEMGEVCLRRIPLQLRVLLHAEGAAAGVLEGRVRAAGARLPAFQA